MGPVVRMDTSRIRLSLLLLLFLGPSLVSGVTSRGDVAFTKKKTKFRCQITLEHTWTKVDIQKSTVKCTPSKPKRVTINNRVLVSGGFSFRMNLGVNPNKIKSIKITK